jgi:cyclopropane fatty-acyl-phospholipid synthase-like methyltransferase
MYEQNAVDRERLRAASGLLNQLTSEACVRARIQAGAHAIDVGCGQLGALPLLTDLVGPGGVVVGLDASPNALAAARAVLATMGLDAVHLVEADINSVDPPYWLPGRHLTWRCAVFSWSTNPTL